ncbi:MAG: hypothetical protein C1943_08925 [Halochromatium sp.]|nr:hypothetical protein [Halochromatium sp.]
MMRSSNRQGWTQWLLIGLLAGLMSQSLLAAEPLCSTDIDGDGLAEAGSDGKLLVRHLFGFQGSALTDGLLGADCTRCDGATIVNHLESIACQVLFDVDGDGARRPLTDGLLLWRLLSGYSGSELIAGALGEEATRRDPEAIRGWLAAGVTLGSLQVNIEPEAARTDGAQWRRVGMESWNASGASEAGLIAGRQYTVEFKPVTGWSAPGQTSVTIVSEQTRTLSATYASAFDADLQAEGFEGRTLLHQVTVSHGFEVAPDWVFELLNPPNELTHLDDGLLAYEAPWGSGGTEVDFSLRITNPDDGVSRDFEGQFTIMPEDVITQGTIGAEGGEISDPETGIRLVVPAGAVSADTLFVIVRGTDSDGALHYTVHTDPADIELQQPLELHIPPLSQEAVSAPRTGSAKIEPSFVEEGWTEWDHGGALLFDSNDYLNVARNRVPPGKGCHVEQALRPYLVIWITSHITTCVYEDRMWALSSRCGEPSQFEDEEKGCPGKPPVLLIHGYQQFANVFNGIVEGDFNGIVEGELKGGDKYWNELPTLLEQAGYAVFGFQWRTSQRFQDGAADLATAIAQIKAVTGQKVHLIAHSFGGLLARTYLQNLATGKNYANDVADLVTIATPHSGIADEGTFIGQDGEYLWPIRLPDGRSQGGWVMPNCRQLSCYQAGTASSATYTILSGAEPGSTRDMREYLGVNPDEPGEIPVLLATAADPMPVPMLALYGLTATSDSDPEESGGLICANVSLRYETGDGFISWMGQRADPSFSCPELNEDCAPTAIGEAQASERFPMGLTERVLLDTESGRSIYPGQVQPLGVTCEQGWSPPLGYRHSTAWPVSLYGSQAQTDISTDNGATHAVYRAVLDWLQGDPDPGSGTYPLNDTGIDWCADGNSNFLNCPVAGYPWQDAQDGRDAHQNDPNDGHAGFSFTKLDASGRDLPADAADWSCVRDNVTGLIWEVKTDDGGLHDKDDRYNWYNTDPATNGGFEGYADDDGAICDGYDRNDPATYCNTQAYVSRVNAQGLCGARDWRLPSRQELLSIVSNDRYRPAIDTDYFPNTVASWFWSASPYAYGSYGAWVIGFSSGNDPNGYKGSGYAVRLVRGGQ